MIAPIGVTEEKAVGSTRERIIAAAREVYERNGTRGTTTREIAERAGVNEATIFRQFGSKNSLLETMREASCDAGGFAHVVSSLTGDLRADLQTMCMAMLRVMTENRAIIRVALAEQENDPQSIETSWRGPQQISQQIVMYLQRHVAAGTIRGNPVHLSSFLMGIAFSFAMKSDRVELLDPTFRDPEQVMAGFVDVFLNGIWNKE